MNYVYNSYRYTLIATVNTSLHYSYRLIALPWHSLLPVLGHREPEHAVIVRTGLPRPLVHNTAGDIDVEGIGEPHQGQKAHNTRFPHFQWCLQREVFTIFTFHGGWLSALMIDRRSRRTILYIARLGSLSHKNWACRISAFRSEKGNLISLKLDARQVVHSTRPPMMIRELVCTTSD